MKKALLISLGILLFAVTSVEAASEITTADTLGVAISGDYLYAGDESETGPNELRKLEFTGDSSDSLNGVGGWDKIINFKSYSAAHTATVALNNGGIVQMTVAGEVTLWDCETANVGQATQIWVRDAEAVEVVPGTGSGDNFVLFDGTALTAGNELDIPATAGNKVMLICTADDTWSVYAETETTTDGGAAD